jgi:S-adenosylmethionine hydrolase
VPLVTLTTDFGTADPYVAEMKGVLVSQGPPDLSVLDLSHELPAFDVQAAALFLRSAVPRFPAHSIHVVVVDPGVGSERAPIVVALHDQWLVGPDNRVFGYLYDGSEQVYVVDPERVAREPLSGTFHGRDLFAPVAARLARGAAPSEFARPCESYQHMVFPLVELSGDTLLGRVIKIDRFGNLITNVTLSVLRGFLQGGSERSLVVSLGERHVRGLVHHYAEAKPGELLALIGSSQLLELSIREGSAAEKLGAQVGRPVRVQRG